MYNYHSFKKRSDYFNNFCKVINSNQLNFRTYLVIIDFGKNWVIQNFVDNKVIHSLNFITFNLRIITNKLDFIDQLNNLMASYFEISPYSV